MKVFGFGTDDI